MSGETSMPQPFAAQRSTPVALALGISTTVSYGTLYYAFGVVAAEMSRDTGLSLTTVYGIFSAGMLGAAAVAPFTGRALDRFNPATIMVAGSFASALFLFLLAMVPGPVALATFLILSQLASTAVLYETAFTVATVHVPDASRRTITIITLLAGFASTIFWPLTLWLGNSMDWRSIYTMFAAMHLAFCVPLHAWLAVNGRTGDRSKSIDRNHDATASSNGRVGDGGPRREAFVLMLVCFATIGFAIASVHLHLIGILDEIGLAASAALIGALIGPAQVAGRLAEFMSGGRLPALRLMILSCATLAIGLVMLVAGPAVTVVAALAMMIYGIGQGLSSILRGVLPLEVLGTKGFGALLGKFSAAALTMMAIAPVITAAIREAYGARMAVAAIACVAIAGTIASIRLNIIVRRWERRQN